MQMIGTPVRLESEARPQERAWERARALKGTHRRSKAREDITRLYRITARMGEPHCIICGQTNQRHSNPIFPSSTAQILLISGFPLCNGMLTLYVSGFVSRGAIFSYATAAFSRGWRGWVREVRLEVESGLVPIRLLHAGGEEETEKKMESGWALILVFNLCPALFRPQRGKENEKNETMGRAHMVPCTRREATGSVKPAALHLHRLLKQWVIRIHQGQSFPKGNATNRLST
ncbi:hypothetical protein QQF64_003747 [Cirrhinus molitorella]|uniref:Uncharacterized protein n=1 Tax=Cirrhinus molitorella TaxID=172907 RepID=A0ABR3MM84_9TELE